ncbi:MAG: hypothetical protein MUO27_05840 [Sedimentisphaerales bacterium]|nr:hypothetical protein [Sedimentisphaerales bacterium]
MAMENQANENIEKLFGEFLSEEDSRRAAENVQKGERILREHPAPAPAGELLADINSKVVKALAAKGAKTRRLIACKVAAVAAVVIILIVISAKFFGKGPAVQTPVTLEPIQRAVWESDGVSVDRTELALLTDEIEHVEGEILTLRLGENGENGGGEFVEIEMELTDIGSDFWKG